MVSQKMKKIIGLLLAGVSCFCLGTASYAALSSGLGGVAGQAIGSFSNIAKLVTAGAYVGGMAFALAALLKFKAHKDNPTQIQLSQAVVLLFISIALIFMPSVFQVGGATLFGSSGYVADVSGLTSFGAPKPVSK